MCPGHAAHCINEIEYANTGIAHFHISSHTVCIFRPRFPAFLLGVPVVAFL